MDFLISQSEFGLEYTKARIKENPVIIIIPIIILVLELVLNFRFSAALIAASGYFLINILMHINFWLNIILGGIVFYLLVSAETR